MPMAFLSKWTATFVGCQRTNGFTSATPRAALAVRIEADKEREFLCSQPDGGDAGYERGSGPLRPPEPGTGGRAPQATPGTAATGSHARSDAAEPVNRNETVS